MNETGRRFVAALVISTVAWLMAPLESRASAVEYWVPAELVRHILTDPEVGKYLHLELSDRRPVPVCAALVGPDFDPTVLSFEITFVSGDRCNDKRVFQFTRVKYDARRASVEVSYPIEGMGARFKFARNDTTWVLESRKVWEH